MKKFLTLICVALCLTACNSDEPEQKPQISSEVREVWAALSGTFSTTFKLFDTGKDWYTETITFHPYSEPKKILPPFTSQSGDVYAFGTCDIVDTRFVDISGTSRCYYSIGFSATAKLTITFFEYEDDNGSGWGREDKRNIRLLTSDSFEMWNYGLAEDSNVQVYTKQ